VKKVGLETGVKERGFVCVALRYVAVPCGTARRRALPGVVLLYFSQVHYVRVLTFVGFYGEYENYTFLETI